MKTISDSKRTLMIALLTASLVTTSEATIRARVDGLAIDFTDAQPVMVNNRVMVPLRGVFEKLNASVEYDSLSHKVTAQHGGDKIELTLGSRTANMNGSDLLIDVAPYTTNGSTMVPLRFVSEAMKAEVGWVEETQTVEIVTSTKLGAPMDMPGLVTVRLLSNTVIPFRLDQVLSSKLSKVGDPFKATLDTNGELDYQGLPSGTQIEGHVAVATPFIKKTPGVLGLTFDWIRLPDGQSYRVYGSLSGLENVDIDSTTGRIFGRTNSQNDDLKFVGYGAAGGVLVSLLTKGKVVDNALIGGALGYLLGQLKPDEKKAMDVVTTPRVKFGVKLSRDLMFRVRHN